MEEGRDRRPYNVSPTKPSVLLSPTQPTVLLRGGLPALQPISLVLGHLWTDAFSLVAFSSMCPQSRLAQQSWHQAVATGSSKGVAEVVRHSRQGRTPCSRAGWRIPIRQEEVHSLLCCNVPKYDQIIPNCSQVFPSDEFAFFLSPPPKPQADEDCTL